MAKFFSGIAVDAAAWKLGCVKARRTGRRAAGRAARTHGMMRRRSVGCTPGRVSR